MKHHTKTIGCAIAVAGVLIILGMILPSSFWWFILGFIMIILGLTIAKR